jgi:dTDP-4-dehydrorhamnose reductase
MKADHLRRILLFGANGQLGHELNRFLPSLGHVTALDRSRADFGRPESLREIVRSNRPDVIVNAAAYTAVDRAEREEGLARTINAVAPKVLAEEAEALQACLVHYSTDYVFDGTKQTPYVETDEPNPLSAYGRSKREGELALSAACSRHLILRTSWVFGVHGSNFLKTILRLAGERNSLRVVADQLGTPTHAQLIAQVTSTISTALLGSAHNRHWGLYHLTGGGETNWHEYASYIVARGLELGLPLKAGPDSVVAISTAAYPTEAMRPANSRMSTAKLQSTFGIVLPNWKTGVDHVLGQLAPCISPTERYFRSK